MSQLPSCRRPGEMTVNYRWSFTGWKLLSLSKVWFTLFQVLIRHPGEIYSPTNKYAHSLNRAQAQRNTVAKATALFTCSVSNSDHSRQGVNTFIARTVSPGEWSTVIHTNLFCMSISNDAKNMDLTEKTDWKWPINHALTRIWFVFYQKNRLPVWFGNHGYMKDDHFKIFLLVLTLSISR